MIALSRRMPAFFVASAVVLSAVGCTSRTHYPRPADEPPRAVTASHPHEMFVYARQPVPAVLKLERQDDKYWISTFSMKSAGENGQDGNLVTARYFRSKRPGPKPLVIILPIWGVHTLPSDALRRHITEHGAGSMNVLRVHGLNRLFDMERMALSPTPSAFTSHVRQMARRIFNTVIDVRRMVDWAETQPDIDRGKVALVGFSLSAMVASLVLSNEPRIVGGVLAMGSASPHDAFATCGGGAGRLRQMITRRFNWSDAQFRYKLKSELARIDPARFPDRVDPRRILIIEAGKDTCLPASARRRLWQAMGRPERIVYHYDHRAAFLAMTFLGGGVLQQEAFQFLERSFGLGPRRAEPDGRTDAPRLAGN